MKNNSLRHSSKEQWQSKIQKIIEQATLEATRNTSRFASVFSLDDGMAIKNYMNLYSLCCSGIKIVFLVLLR